MRVAYNPRQAILVCVTYAAVGTICSGVLATEPSDTGNQSHSQSWREGYFAGHPLEIGTRVQFLFDDYMVEDRFGLKRVVGPVEKHVNNPLPTPAGENIIFDPQDKLYRSWGYYRKYEDKSETGYNRATTIAESKDGIHWEYPELDYMLIGNVDEREYNRFVKENEHLSDDDRAWMEQTWPGPYGLQWHTGMPNAFIPLLRKAREAGSEFNPLVEFKDDGIRIATHWTHFGLGQFGEHLLGGRAAIATGRIDMGDMDMVSLLEQKTRQLAFETVEFLKKYSPGFSQESYLIFLSPFLGSRGGPCIEGEQTLTIDDWAANRRFEDVIFQTFRTKRQVESYAGEDWEPGLDVPYRMMLPKGFDNIYVVARGAAYIRRGHDGVGGMRGKPLMQALGKAGGAAAALCVKSGSSAQTLDIRKLQTELVQQGFNLGDAERLKQLNLIG